MVTVDGEPLTQKGGGIVAESEPSTGLRGDVEPRATRPRSEKVARRTSISGTPWANSRFWLLQIIILALAMIRLAATVAFHLDTGSLALEFSTLGLFLVPVLYAALNYGVAGAASTAGWVTVLCLPQFASALSDRNYVGAWAELAQLILLDALAVLVGQRVTAERTARRQAETAQRAHLSAEALYRNLFDSNQAPILLVDDVGNVIEANASAQRAFRGATSHANTDSILPRNGPVRLVEMIGASAAGQILSQLISEQIKTTSTEDEQTSANGRAATVTREVDGRLVLFRPTATLLSKSNREARMQIVFEDVTAETLRRDLMEAYAARVVLGQEEERRHIAQELHDGPVQTLIHLCRQIDGFDARESLTADESWPLADLRSIVEETVAELRSIAKGLRPSVLDDLGLVASINQIVAETGERREFEASFGFTGAEKRLAPAIELALFRIAQEALSNVERHASATRVAVGLSFDDSGVRLLVHDDGIGFDALATTDATQKGSLGLRGMTERARLIGADLTVHSGAGRGAGTTVDVWVPATIINQN
jgi:signal transduction histidine kinase